MKVVLTCGHPFSGYEQVHAVLLNAGMMEARVSQREGLSPQELQERMARALDTVAGGTVSQIAPGKVWESQAVDLFLSNLDHQYWGWADSRLARFLDFWAGIDPQVRFVLVYCAPEEAVARALSGGVTTAEALQQALALWVEMQTALLRFYHRNRDRCLLVNVDAVVRAPETFLEKVNEHFELPLNHESTGEAIAPESASPLCVHLVKSLGLGGDDPQTNALSAELEAAADLPDGTSSPIALDPCGAFAEYSALLSALGRAAEIEKGLHRQLAEVRQQLAEEVSLRIQSEQRDLSSTERMDAQSKELKNAQSALAEERAKNAELSQEGELILLQLHQVQEELEAQFLKGQESEKTLQQQLAEVRQQLEAEVALRKSAEQRDVSSRERMDAQSIELKSAQSALTGERAKNTELSQESELLLLQLHQVQEELEHYYLQVQELQGKGYAATGYRGAGFLSLMQPVEMTFDLRRDIDGENWWDAESDGRWAGPEPLSRLALPPLGAGRYEILLDVVDAVTPEVLSGMQVAMNGRPISVEVMKGGFPALVFGRFAVDEDSLDARCNLELRFPRILSPAELGTNPEDRRHLAIRLRSVRVSVLDTGLPATVTGSIGAGLVPLGLMDATIDLRKDVLGNNWWDAEPDGRWAGPEQVSSLAMPALGPGRYEFQLKVVDAMTPAILSGMQVTLNGKPITVDVTRPGYPTLVVGQFEADEVDAEANWTFELRFPSLKSPAELGTDAGDRRLLAIRARSLRVGAAETDTETVSKPKRSLFFWRGKKRGSGGRKTS
jgi:hypothetical protein